MRPEKIEMADAEEFYGEFRAVARPLGLASGAPLPKTLANHRAGQCLFPVGSEIPEGGDASRQLFCFEPVEAPGARYCAQCAGVAFQPYQRRSA